MEALNTAETWEPRLRITSSIKKLKGVHPVSIIIDDLSRHQTKNMYNDKNMLKNMKKMLEDCCQSTVSDENKSVSIGDQIDILISIATSSSILVRQYRGLETWL